MVSSNMDVMKVLSLIVVTLLIVNALPQKSVSHGRSRRGFRQSIVDRMGHGFGKRADSSLYDSYLDSDRQHDFMTVEELAGNIMQSSELAEAVVKKFIDTDNDGIVSTEELLFKTTT